MLFRIVVLIGCAALAALAQEGEAITAAETGSWLYSAAFDSYGSLNFNHPKGGASSLRNFDGQSGQAVFNAAMVDVEYKSSHLGFHLTGGDGEMLRTMASSDPLQGLNRYIMQGYISYRPLAGSPLQLDFGKFYTSVGAEVPDALSNFNYSRSLLFALGAPYYHFGLRVSVPLSKHLTVGVQLVNGWNDVRDNNTGKTLGLSTAYVRGKWSWTQVYMTGPETAGTNRGNRRLLDQIVTFRPNSRFEGYAEALYGYERRATVGNDRWYGLAIATRFKISRALSFSPRVEWFGDPTGFTSGMPQHLLESTATLEYRLNSPVVLRTEYRRDLSNRNYFQRGGGLPSRDQETALIALLIYWKGEHAGLFR